MVPPIAPTIHQMYGIGSTIDGLWSGPLVLFGELLKAERDSKNAGSKALFSAVALPGKKQVLQHT